MLSGKHAVINITVSTGVARHELAPCRDFESAAKPQRTRVYVQFSFTVRGTKKRNSTSLAAKSYGVLLNNKAL